MSDEGRTERERLVGRAGVVGAGTLLSRIFGFARDVVIAALFTRMQTDAFAAALTIPNALRQLLAEGAVTSAVVPVLTGRLAAGGDDAGRAFFARARGVSLGVLVCVSLAGVVLAAPLAWLFAGGYADEPGKLELTTRLTRVMFPYIFFMGTAALGMAALNAKRKFGVAAFAPALFNVGVVLAAFLLRAPLADRGVDPSVSLAIGVLVGGVLQVVAQAPALRAIGYGVRPVMDLGDPHVREMLRRIGPMTFGLGIYYVDIVLSRRFLSELPEGAQSYFFWASRICDFPQGIFVMALSTAALPSLATFAAKGDHEELGRTWAHGMRLALFVAVPCSAALVAAGEPLVALVFERGHFDALASRETAHALAWQGGAIFTVAAVRQLVSVFHALGDTRTPVIVSALDLVVFVVLAVALRGPFGHVGISMAIAGSSGAQMALLFFALRMRLPDAPLAEIARSATRVAVAALVAGAAAWVAAKPFDGRRLPGVAAALAFGAVFLVAVWALRAPELAEIARPIRRRLVGRGRAG